MMHFFFSKLQLFYPFSDLQHSVLSGFYNSRFITDINYSEGNIEWGEQTVTLWTTIEFFCFYARF